MATSPDYINYICEQLDGIGEITYKKMFGEYMIYLNKKPVITVCDNTLYVKKLDCLIEKLQNAELGFPYEGAKEHYILDIDNPDFCKEVILEVEKVIPLPKPRNKSKKISTDK